MRAVLYFIYYVNYEKFLVSPVMRFDSEKHLAEFVKSLGGELWLVGGSVRDKLMGNDKSDDDFVITGLSVDQLPFEKIVGSDFPVFLVEIGGRKCEVAMARTESKNGTGYHGFTFFSDPSVTIAQDLARRDLTINAMAENVLTGDIVDPFNGRLHLNLKILRHTTGAFAEDPLRVYRVARFAAKFGFTVAGETLVMLRGLKDELPALKAERVFKELEKVLALDNPRAFFDVLKNANVLDVHFNEVAALDVPDKHDGTAYNHVMNLLRHGRTTLEKFALLTHDFGKGLTPKEKHPAHHGHDQIGKQAVIDFCERLRMPSDWQKFAVNFCAEHMRLKVLAEMKSTKIVKTVLSYKDNIHDFLHLTFIDSACREGGDIKAEFIKSTERHRLAKKVFAVAKEINGDTLLAEGKTPSPEFGEMLLARRAGRLKYLMYLQK